MSDNRRTREPAVVRPGRNTKLRTRVRVQWLVLAAAATVLAGTVVAWALSSAADRIEVVGVARPLRAGDTIEAADLRVSEVAFDAGVTGLVPATSLDRLAGRVAVIDLAPGALLSVGMWADEPQLAAGEHTVGAVLEPGRFPPGLTGGAVARAVSIDRSDATSERDADSDTVALGEASVRVLAVSTTDSGGVVATLAVQEADAERVAQLAATATLVLIGVPSTAEVDASSTTGVAP